MRLRGRNALVTGAGAGIGRASAERLLQEGANVLAVDIDEASLQWITGNPRGVAITSSVNSLAANLYMVEQAERKFGRLSIAHLNAGAGRVGSILDADESAFEDCIAVNMRAIAYGIRAVVPSMIAAGSGSIIITNSIAGLAGDAGVWAYSATKAGSLGIVRSAAADLALKGIRVNAICPGPVLTNAGEAVRLSEPATFERFRARVPMQRWAMPSEIAAAVVFLASDDSVFITGVALPVDGGLSATNALFAPARE